MNVHEMIKYCNMLVGKYGDEIILSWNGPMEVYDFENRKLETVK